MERAWDYALPGLAASEERDLLLQEARANEAARQQALVRQFGSQEQRAQDIISLETLRRAQR
jgi:hypothetical protein